MRSANWLRTKNYIIACGGGFCQRVSRDDHRRCREIGVILHHIIASDRAALMGIFYDPRNLVMVCRSCHPNAPHEDQGWYTPTVWVDPGSTDPIPEPLCQPGHRAPDASKLWDIKNRQKYFRRLLTAT